MAYDEGLAARYRNALHGLQGISEKRMMGGVCFMLDGNMIGGAHREDTGRGVFMFRVGKEREAEALTRPGAHPVQLGKRRMGGMIFVNEQDCSGDTNLSEWISLALGFVSSLPAKAPKEVKK